MSLSIRAQAPRKSPRGPSSRKMEATQCTGPLYRGGGLPSCALGSVWFCSRTLTRSKGLKQQACRKGSVKGLGGALGWGVAYLNEREAVGRVGSIFPQDLAARCCCSRCQLSVSRTQSWGWARATSLPSGP